MKITYESYQTPINKYFKKNTSFQNRNCYRSDIAHVKKYGNTTDTDSYVTANYLRQCRLNIRYVQRYYPELTI